MASDQQGVGLLVVDVVTDRHRNWHAELLKRRGRNGENGHTQRSVAAHRPVERNDQTSLNVWRESLKLGSILTTMPPWLKGNLCLPVDLEATYDRTCRVQRITSVKVSRPATENGPGEPGARPGAPESEVAR